MDVLVNEVFEIEDISQFVETLNACTPKDVEISR